MQKHIKLTSLLALMLGLTVSCSENPGNTPDPDVLNAPTGLTVGTLTETTAELSWTGVEGAEKYNVVIGDMDAVAVTKTSYNATDLTAETAYTWKVQAVKGDTVSEWAVGEVFTTSAYAPVTTPAPTDLTVAGTTATSVQIHWNHPDADRHEVSIDEGNAYEIMGLGCTVNGLSAETSYTWKVRSCKNDVWSEWTQGDVFTTGPRTRLTFIDLANYWGTYFGYPNAVTFALGFYDEQLNNTMQNGIQVTMDLVVATADIDMSESVEILDIPNGKYTVGIDPATTRAYMVYGPNSAITNVAGGRVSSQSVVIGGAVEITGDHTNYHIIIDFALENGTSFAAVYDGPFNLENPYYVPPAGEPIDFGTLTTMLAMDYRQGFAGGRVDMYAPIGGEPGTTLADGKFGGTGWVFGTQMFAAANSGHPMPDGTYTINPSYNSGTAIAWNGSAGTRLLRMEGGRQVELYGIVSGTITSTYADGVYTLVVAAIDRSGTQISGTVQASAPGN